MFKNVILVCIMPDLDHLKKSLVSQPNNRTFSNNYNSNATNKMCPPLPKCERKNCILQQHCIVVNQSLPTGLKLILPFSQFQASKTNSYSFEYSTQDGETGITHSRKETADEFGVVRGVYELLEPNCIIRRIEYQADQVHGFQILGMSTKSCKEESVPKKAFKPTLAPKGYIPAPTQPGKNFMKN